MTDLSKLLKFGLSCALILLLFRTAAAGENEPSEFEQRYQPSQREVCEMYASADTLGKFTECKSMKLFEPSLEANLTDSKNAIVEISKVSHPSWSFPDVSFKKRNPDWGVKESIFSIKGESGSVALEEILPQDLTVISIAIGNIDNAIVLEVRGKVHTQIIFTPTSCKGLEGYGDEVFYELNQVFQWTPTFANEVYEKRFYSPSLCN